MLKSKRKKNDTSQSPSKKALSSDYDHDQAINPEDDCSRSGAPNASTVSNNSSDSKSWHSGSRSSSRQEKKTSKSKQKPDEISIKMPQPSTPKTRKPPSRFSLRGWLLSNPIFPPPFGQNSSNQRVSSPRGAKKSSKNSSNAGVLGASGGQETFDSRSICSSLHGGPSSSQHGASGGSTVLKECPLCLGEWTLDQFPRLRNCSHLFCLECLTTYTKMEIHDGRVNLKCPQCNEVMHPNGKWSYQFMGSSF